MGATENTKTVMNRNEKILLGRIPNCRFLNCSSMSYHNVPYLPMWFRGIRVSGQFEMHPFIEGHLLFLKNSLVLHQHSA